VLSLKTKDPKGEESRAAAKAEKRRGGKRLSISSTEEQKADVVEKSGRGVKRKKRAKGKGRKFARKQRPAQL